MASDATKNVCPDADECSDMLLSLLPAGRAWQSADATVDSTTSVLKQFFKAVGSVWADFETAVCDGLGEFFCLTANTMLDAWEAEYGLPDECDPNADDLCSRAEANGGVSIQYYRKLAADTGWSAVITWSGGKTLHVVIDSVASAAIGEVSKVGIAAVGGDWALGDADATRLICRLERIVPAHVAITYEVV